MFFQALLTVLMALPFKNLLKFHLSLLKWLNLFTLYSQSFLLKTICFKYKIAFINIKRDPAQSIPVCVRGCDKSYHNLSQFERWTGRDYIPCGKGVQLLLMSIINRRIYFLIPIYFSYNVRYESGGI